MAPINALNIFSVNNYNIIRADFSCNFSFCFYIFGLYASLCFSIALSL